MKWIPFSPTNLVYAEGVTMELDSSEILKARLLILSFFIRLYKALILGQLERVNKGRAVHIVHQLGDIFG